MKCERGNQPELENIVITCCLSSPTFHLSFTYICLGFSCYLTYVNLLDNLSRVRDGQFTDEESDMILTLLKTRPPTLPTWMGRGPLPASPLSSRGSVSLREGMKTVTERYSMFFICIWVKPGSFIFLFNLVIVSSNGIRAPQQCVFIASPTHLFERGWKHDAWLYPEMLCYMSNSLNE